MTTQTRLFEREFPKRPGRYDEAVTKKVAQALLDDVAEWADSADDKDRILADLTKILGDSFDDDGYAISKDMERRGYSPDADLVEILDRASVERYSAHKEVMADWVRANDLTLSIPVGAAVSVKMGGKDHVGQIRDRDPATAQYAVFIPALGHVRSGVGTHGVIVGFEEVTETKEGASHAG